MLKLRPELRKFVQQMEANLQIHDAERGETGWDGETIGFLMDRLDEELQELIDVLRTYRGGRQGAQKVRKEAADVANFCMMIADVV